MEATALITRLTELATEIAHDPVIECKKGTDRIEVECLLHHIRMVPQWTIPTPTPTYREGEFVWVTDKTGTSRARGTVCKNYKFVSGKVVVTVLVEIGDGTYPVEVSENYLLPRWDL